MEELYRVELLFDPTKCNVDDLRRLAHDAVNLLGLPVSHGYAVRLLERLAVELQTAAWVAAGPQRSRIELNSIRAVQTESLADQIHEFEKNIYRAFGIN